VTWPERTAPAFAATASPTVPPPFPVEPDDTAIQLAVLAAVHAQPVIVATETERLPPADAIVSLARLSVKLHGAAAWVTETLAAPTTMAPERAAGTGLGATVYGIDASPWPPEGVIDTQLASVLIDQVQSRSVAIVSDP